MKFKIKNLIFIAVATLFTTSIFALPVFASTTNGTIDSTYKYAWSENGGWINFDAPNGNVGVTDSGLSGSALSENIGWINLSAVINDGAGNLSGYAWSENAGWINFAPTNGGVTINSSGQFTGSALGENIGWIVFDCSTSACVTTDWRPQSARICTSWTYSNWSSCSASQQTRAIVTSSPSGCAGGSPVLTQSCTMPGGGGGMPAGWSNVPIAPKGGFKVSVNSGASTTANRIVTLNLNAGSDVKKMAISLTGDFTDASQENYSISKQIDLCSKLGGLIKNPTCPDGKYMVYVKFYTAYGVASNVVSTKISLTTSLAKNVTQNSVSAIFLKPLAFGITSNDVRRLQTLLATKPEIYPEGLITGYFGLLTKQAVQRFQLNYGVVVSKSDPGYGYVGPKTRTKLQEVFGK